MLVLCEQIVQLPNSKWYLHPRRLLLNEGVFS